MDTNNQSPLVPGTQLDHFKIIKTLGQGGFGITYLAMDQRENRPVVIKEYFPSDISIRTAQQTQLSLLSSDKRNDFNEGLARFKREAITLGEFNHPNIVKVQLYFEANGTAYFVMEYAEGQSLQAYQESLGRPLSESELQTHVFPILEGLSAVHNKKLLHLDIKPDNILKTEGGEPLLIDFGGARVDTAKASKVISQHSSMVGTAGFSPPEQYTQVAEQTVATDLYAFGMTLYRLIAPQENIPDSQDRQAFVYLQDKPDPLKPIRSIASGYSEALYQVIESCTRLRQKERPQSVEAIQAQLNGINITPEAAETSEKMPAQAAKPSKAGNERVLRDYEKQQARQRQQEYEKNQRIVRDHEVHKKVTSKPDHGGTLREDETRYWTNWCSPAFYYWVSILTILIGISLRIVFDTWPSGFTGLDTSWNGKALVAFPGVVWFGSILLDEYKNKINFVKFFPISTTMMGLHFLCINVAYMGMSGSGYLLSLLFGKNVEMDIFGLSNIIPAEEYFAFLIIFILMHHTKLAKKIENSDLFQSGFSTSNPVIFTIFFGVSFFVMDKYI